MTLCGNLPLTWVDDPIDCNTMHSTIQLSANVDAGRVRTARKRRAQWIRSLGFRVVIPLGRSRSPSNLAECAIDTRPGIHVGFLVTVPTCE
jgi:hypothetical protein